MTIKEAMQNRHTVRKYTDRRLEKEVVDQLIGRIKENNEAYGLEMELVTEDTAAFGPLLRLVLAKGVRNYIILAGKNVENVDEKLGYSGTDVMLFAQTLGLNSWWVGGTYNKKGVEKKVAGTDAALADTKKVVGMIAIGYGAANGVPHKSKSAGEISSYNGTAPEWFKNGVEAVLLAPTALNKQAFTIKGDGSKVSMTCNNGGFSGVDLGIGKYHFETGAGKGNFEWV